MKNILAISGSPRKNSNSTILMENFIKGAKDGNANIIIRDINDLNIKPCTGCLRCNLVKKCTLRNDDWELLKDEILNSDILVFAAPVYFHHLPGPLKTLIDRFRSFVHVQITETGLVHTPHTNWNKKFVLLLTMGSGDIQDAEPIKDLFEFLTNTLGENNELFIKCGTRLAVAGQLIKSEYELESLYEKLGLGFELADKDFLRNRELIDECFDLGKDLSNK